MNKPTESTTLLNVGTIVFLTTCAVASYYNSEQLIESFKPHSSHLDWCEANYKVSPHIAEFWNVATGLFLYLPGLFGHFAYKGTRDELHEPNLYIIWLMFWISAAGSMYFHTSLSIAGQVLDEMPLIVLAFFGVQMGVPKHKWPSLKLRTMFFSWQCAVCLNVGFLLANLLYPTVSHFLVLASIPECAIMLFGGFYYCKEKPWTFMSLCIFFLLLSFSCWGIDRFACAEATDFFESTIGFYP
jgi:alkaline ceramidase